MSASGSQILRYLEGQPGTVHLKLYKQPSTALAVFRRMLPHLAKTFVMAMLYMPGPFLAADLDTWIRPDARAEKEQALTILESLHIISTVSDNPKLPAYKLAAGFAKSLRQALTGGGDHKSFGVPCSTPDEKAVDVNMLDAFAREQWESILYHMVGNTLGVDFKSTGQTMSGSVKTLLKEGGFTDQRDRITKDGFTFVLQDTNAQVWSLLIVYLHTAPKLRMEEVDVLSFLFTLGSLELGQDYSTENLTETQRHMLEDLYDFGLVYRRPGSDRFYPTRLATTLTSDAGALTSSTDKFDNSLAATTPDKGYIIIETNYRLYAYTNSLLQIGILSLFSKLTTRFPNLVSGKLTKESIQRAISYGITATQIVDYLATHAHPQMQKSMPVLPPTVVDQIKLWQLEGDRMKATHGYLFREFNNYREYEELRNFADTIGALVWKNDKNWCFFTDNFQQVSAHLRAKTAPRQA